MLSNALHSLKARSPMEVTESGITALFNLLHPSENGFSNIGDGIGNHDTLQ
jgi:hypothetical protein